MYAFNTKEFRTVVSVILGSFIVLFVYKFVIHRPNFSRFATSKKIRIPDYLRLG